MSGLPNELLERLQFALERSDSLKNHRDLRAIFLNDDITMWRDKLPETDSLTARINQTIDYLRPKNRKQGNGLVLFLRVLQRNTPSDDLLHDELGQLAEEVANALPPPPTTSSATLSASLPLPDVDNFIGRWTELEQLKTHWQNGHKYALIYGLGGIGKSWLVSYFLQHEGGVPSEQIFWYDFGLMPNFMSFATQLTRFLGLKPPEQTEPLAYSRFLLTELGRQPLVLVLDNFESCLTVPETGGAPQTLNIAEPAMAQFMELLTKFQHQAKVLLTTRYRPDFGVQNRVWQRIPDHGLAGLNEAESRHLLPEGYLSEAEWRAFYQQLDGHPTALELLRQLLEEGYTAQDLLVHLEELRYQPQKTPFIEKVATEFLDLVYGHLSGPEQEALHRVTVLRRPFDQTLFRAFVEPPPPALQVLEQLARKALVQRRQLLYSLHPLVQAYLHARLPLKEQGLNHRRAAKYYQQVDEALEGWHDINDLTPILEAVYHWYFVEPETAQSLFADADQFLQRQGISSYLQGDYEVAEKIVRTRLEELAPFIERSAKHRTQYGKDHFYLANLLRRQGQTDAEVERLFAAACRHAPSYAPSYQAWAVLKREQGDFEAARKLFQQGLQHDPAHAPIYQAWGLLEKERGDFEAARNLFQQGLQHDPKDAPSYQAWGLLEKERGDFEAARNLFQQGLQHDPAHAPSYQAWGLLEKEQGNLNKARDLFQQGLQHDPANAPSYQAWGLLEKEQGNLNKARDLFQQGLQHAPKDVYLLTALAELETKRRNNKQAMALLTKAVEIAPKDGYVWYQLGEVHFYQRQYGQAADCYRKAARLIRKPLLKANNWNKVAQALERHYAPDEEIEAAYRAAIGAYSRHNWAQANYANFLAQRNWVQEAIAHFKRSLAARENRKVRGWYEDLLARQGRGG